MPFNITDFLGEMNQSGYSRASSFDVHITGPAEAGSTDMERSLKMRAHSTNIPGRNVTASDYRPYGIVTKIAYDVILQPCSVSIILSEDMREKLYFESWQDKMIGKFRDGETTTSMFNLGFYDDYIGTVIINQYDDTGKKTFETKLIEAYPLDVADIQTSWDQGGEVLRLPIQFAYRYFVDKRTPS